MIEAIIGAVWPYVLGALALLAGWVAARKSGKAAGRTEARIDQLEADSKAAERARHVENETAAMDDDAVTDELIRDWVRDRRG